jgi:hypothetical protein
MVVNGSCLPVTSVGAAGPPGLFRMPDVLVAPSLVHNLLSIRRFTTDNTCSVEFDSFGLTVKDSATRRPLLRCDSTGPLYTIRFPHATSSSSSPPDTAAGFAASMSSTTWHHRLGHPRRDALMQLTRSATIPCTRSPEEHLCHACQLGRHVPLPFSSSSSHATHAFDLVHCDLWTSPITSMSGYKYYLVVLDDFSHYVWTFPLRAKSETFPTLRHFFAWVSTQFGLTIKAVQCDNSREFDNSASRDFVLSHGMQLRMSCSYTSSQNGKAERMIRMTNDTIRTLLLQAHPQHVSGPRPFTPLLTSSTVYLLLRAWPPLLTRHSSLPLRAMTTSVSSGVLATRTPLPLLLTCWHPVPPFVCFSGTPWTTRATAALTSPLAGSSSLAMWCLMNPHFPTPPPHHPPLTLTLTSSLSFRLTRWSSHLFSLSLQVLAHRLSVLLPARCLAQVRWCRLRWCRLSMAPRLRSRPGRAGVVGLHRLRGHRYQPLQLTSPSWCGSTSTDYRRRVSPLSRRRRCHRRWPSPCQGHLHLRRSHPQHVSRRRCTTHRSFTATRSTSTRW